MPPSKRAYLARRCRQADAALRRSQVWLASIWVTMAGQHPELTPEILAYIGAIDGVRRGILEFKRHVLGGTERDLWKPGDFDTILATATPVTDPKARR